MLVISRKMSQSIIINDNIEIIISDIGSDKVKLAINAPRDVRIFRKELLEVRQQNQQASEITSKKTVDLLKGLLK